MKKTWFLLFLFVLKLATSDGQKQPDDYLLKNVSAEVSKQIDEVYAAFSKSYTLLDASLTSQCYVEKAVIISHYSNQTPTLIYGRQAIQRDFENFFARVSANKETMSIHFKIIERKTDGDLIFDKGYYQVVSSKDAQVLWTSYGKIAIVLEKDKSGNWKYTVDTNATATETEFTQAVQLK
jgi:ketosteroid isomerase-like protein